MSYINLAIATKTSRAQQIATALGSNAVLSIYTGTYPTSPDVAATGTLLGMCVCANGVFGTVTSGVLTANAIAQGLASNSGTAAWARFAASSGTAIIDADVGTSGTSVTINTTAVASGGPLQVTSCTFSEV